MLNKESKVQISNGFSENLVIFFEKSNTKKSDILIGEPLTSEIADFYILSMENNITFDDEIL